MTASDKPNRSALYRYTRVAIWLHWLMAGLLVGLIFVGWNMGEAPREVRFQLYQMHKTFGIVVLLLTLARVLWRLMNPPPPKVAMPGWQKAVSSATHVLFYLLMIGLPLSGWAYVSASPAGVPTLLFGQAALQWPHMPFFMDMALEARKMLAENIESAHGAMAWGVLVLLGLHVLAALKHQFIDKDRLIARMAPGVAGATFGPYRDARGALLAFGLPILLAAGLIAVAKVAPGAVSQPVPFPVTAEQALEASTVPIEGAAGSVIDPIAVAEPAQPSPTPQTPSAAPVPAPPAASAAPPPAAVEAPVAVAPKPVAQPTSWRINAQNSEIGFTGTHEGAAFKGAFTRWTADISFSPDALDRSSVKVEIDTSSAQTGNPFYDTTLREPDWLDSTRQPSARFEASSFKSLGNGQYQAEGSLRLRGKDVPMTLPFTLTISDGKAALTGGLTLDRLKWDVGRASDESGEWVGLTIGIGLTVNAERAG